MKQTHHVSISHFGEANRKNGKIFAQGKSLVFFEADKRWLRELSCYVFGFDAELSVPYMEPLTGTC